MRWLRCKQTKRQSIQVSWYKCAEQFGNTLLATYHDVHTLHIAFKPRFVSRFFKPQRNRRLQHFDLLCHSILRTVACILLESRLLGGQVFLRHEQDAPFVLATKALDHSLASHPFELSPLFSANDKSNQVYDNNTRAADKRRWEMRQEYKRIQKATQNTKKVGGASSPLAEQHNKRQQKKACKKRIEGGPHLFTQK